MTVPANDVQSRRRRTLLVALVYLAFVIYGSLVPLDFHPSAFAAAWDQFLRTAYLDLDVMGRADWVANILLYIPLAYLWSAVFARATQHAAAQLLRVAIVFAGCVALAVAIEFTQLFFPPRTVSLNDILAEIIGSALGVVGWLMFGRSLSRFAHEISGGGRIAIRAAIAIYTIGYLAYSLFPYDFLVSSQEFAAKFATDSHALWLVPQTCSRYSFCIAKLIVEALAVVPLGAMLGPLLRRSRAPFAWTAGIGLLLGGVIEATQLLIASGVSEGASVLMRAVGMFAGLACYRAFDIRWVDRFRRHLGWIAVMLAPFYLVGLAWANRWSPRGLTGLDNAQARFHDVSLLPFYYHYYTTETLALQSLLFTVAMYAPVGLGYWMWRESTRPGIRGSGAVPAFAAGLLALVIETGKLFVAGTHPDPTNVLIAAVAAAATYTLAASLHRWAIEPAVHAPPGPAPSTVGDVRTPTDAAPGGGAIAGALLLVGGVVAAAWSYPPGAMYLALPLALWSIVLWRWPRLGLPAAVALLPLLDFSDITGWVVVNEFDCFIAISIAVVLLRNPAAQKDRLLDRPGRFALALLALSLMVSSAIGLFPLSPADGNALYSLMTSYSTLRAAKGPLWALLMLPMFAATGPQWRSRMSAGIVAGLGALIGVIVWQRYAFAGLFDTTTDYRVEGTFPELRVGGGDVHAYLVMAAPFVVAWAMARIAVWRFVAACALLVLVSYAVAVTFARGGYVGFAAALAVLAIFAALRAVNGGALQKGIAVALVTMIAAAAVVLPLMSGSFMRARVADSGAEAGVRFNHWTRAIDMMDATPRALLFGMGPGSFPRTMLFKDRAGASASLRYERIDRQSFARLGSGRSLYLEQGIAIEPNTRYTLSFDVRSRDGVATIDVTLCEKTYQYSFGCKPLAAQPVAETEWLHRSVQFDSGDLGAGPIWRKRPLVLAVTNSGQAATLDLRNVQVIDARGVDLVRNGDFAQGGARWNFAADDHLPWHIFNLWVELLFEQGVLGIVAFALAIGVAVARVARAAASGNWFDTAVFAAIIGFLTIGFSESLLDGPRIATLFFLVVIAAFVRRTDGRRGARSSADALQA